MSCEQTVCVVTQPLAAASESATKSLTAVLSAVATVSLVTANLSANSPLRDKHEVIEVSSDGTGTNMAVAALRFVSNQFRMCRVLYQREENVVLFFGTTTYLLPILTARISGQTVILEPRGNVPRSLYHQWRNTYPTTLAFVASRLLWVIEHAGFTLADRIVTLSPGMAAEIGLDTYNGKLHTNGAWHIDTERFSPDRSYEKRNRAVGYVGRLSEEKGLRELVPVVANLPEDITFVFVGDGDLRPWIEDNLGPQIEDGRVQITGWVERDEVPEYLNRLRLCVLLSRTEGLPTTVLESMACGTPVYANTVGGIPDIITHGETGYFAVKDSPAEVANHLVEMLDECDSEISADCRRVIEEEYSFEAAVERYRSIIHGQMGE